MEESRAAERDFGEKHALSGQVGGTSPGVASPQVPLPEATSRTHLATPLPMPEPATDPLSWGTWSISVWITLWAKEEAHDPKEGPQLISLKSHILSFKQLYK